MKPLPAIPISDPTLWLWLQRHLANFGLVSAVPTVDTLKKGDTILYESGTTKRLYFNLNGTIVFITIGSGIAGEHDHTQIRDTDDDTKIQCEESADEDKIRLDTAGSERMVIDENGNVEINETTTIKGTTPDGGLTSYNLRVGNVTTPSYGMIQIGNSVIGRTSYKVGNIDLDGCILIRNIGGPVSGEIEFCFAESTGNTTRFALPKSGVGNATYNPRSMLIAGPAPADTDMVKVSYWQTNNSIFDNLACDTAGDGADLGVQNDLEVEGDIFVDSIKESTTGAGITLSDEVILADTAKVIKSIPIDNANLGKGATKATEVIIGNYNAWAFGINDDSVFTFHIPHDWEFGTDVIINIDWYIDELAGDEIKWQITYSATPHDSTEVVDSAGTTIDTGDIVIPTTPKFLTQNSLTIPAAALAIGDQVGVTLKRIAITGGTNPTNEPGVIDVHIEYTVDKFGEAT